MKAKYLMIATVATMLAACSNDENEVNNGPVEARITAGMGAETRAVNDNPSTWTTNDHIGVMVTKVTAGSGSTTSDMVSRYKNVDYKSNTNGETAGFAVETAGTGIFFQDATETATFAAYYPYTSSTNASTLPGTDGAITIDTQNNNTDVKQATIDFLFASGATASKGEPTVEFKDNSSTSGGINCQFQHKMAQLKLIVVGSTADGFTVDEAKAVCAAGSDYELGGLIHEGTFTLAVPIDGTATGIAATTSASAVDNWNIKSCMHTDSENTYTRTYTLILFPQNCSSSALSFTATIGGQTYTNKGDISPNLEAGNTYEYTITVKKKGLTVSGCTIKGWGTGSTGSGDAIM